MKKVLLTLVGLTTILTSSASWAYVNVRGYYRSNGTYVAPHIRSNPDGNPYNNLGSWSFLEKDKNESRTSPFQPVVITMNDTVV